MLSPNRISNPLHGRFSTPCLAAVVLAWALTPSQAQLYISDQSTQNYVSGAGLSPSYFLPPNSNLSPNPTNQPTPQPNPPTPDSYANSTSNSTAIIGSGIDPTPNPNPVAPLNKTPTQDPLSKSPDAHSIDLDLRSSNPTSFLSPNTAARPLATPSPWFFSANALILQLNDNHSRTFSSSLADPSSSLLNSSDLRMPSTGGYELGIGRYIHCGKFALNANYWTLSPTAAIASVDSVASGPLSTNLPFNTPSATNPSSTDGLFVGPNSLSELFQNATHHQLQSQSEFHNVEINLQWFAIGGAARQPLSPPRTDSQFWNLSEHPTASNAPWLSNPSRLRLSLFSGIRWFQFQDSLNYSAPDAYYKNQVQNDLWGVHSGATTHLSLTPRWSLRSNLAFGVFNNRSNAISSAGNSTGLATISTPGPMNNLDFHFLSSDNNSACLGETTNGLDWHLARGWTASVGYKVLALSGVASSQSQIPSDFRLPILVTQTNDSLLLHGLILGASYNF
jgi:hypothetical protein